MVPFGVFVQVADGVEGLVRLRDLTPAEGEPPGAVRVGDELPVLVAELDREWRRLLLSPADPERADG
ncbi:S1 RNA-binding domain-containing protein [Kitasatospora sp. NPDC091335]|uniref:S1 RNA-binding domain-containing protein n=1 Tax=Kitasatospora sp. NPDC091335 TaxID=3364085 RepID=UPI0038307144